MSGHSKWATTKRQKAATDAKRSALFTKLAKAIIMAARDGADPDKNFKLRIAIDKAKTYSMPKDNIERAVARGSGAGADASQLSTVLYEGFGPGGTALLIEAVTDNKNRAVAEVKHALSKHGGSLGGGGSVSWMFTLRGIISIAENTITDEQELVLIDAGLVDVESHESGASLIVEPDRLQSAAVAATQAGLTVTEAEIGYVANQKTTPENPDSLLSLLEALDDLDDVDAIYTNTNL